MRRVAEERGDPLPRSLANAPELPAHLEGIYLAFVTLSSARSLSYTGLNPISITDIKSYIELFDVTDEEEIESYVRNIRLLDDTFLKDFSKKSKAKASK